MDVRVENLTDDEALLHFRVIDTGIGIPQEKQSLIFDAFEQADTSTTREYGGTGLGLAISRRLVNMMNGELWVESEVSRGSTFHFTTAMGLVPAASRGGDGARAMAAGTRVLVVNGHRTNRDILLEILASWQIEARAVESAEETLSAMAAAEACHVPFGLVIMDAQLPDGNGFHLADAIRSHATVGKTPILTLIAADRAGRAGRPGRRLRLPDEAGEAVGVVRRHTHGIGPRTCRSVLPSRGEGMRRGGASAAARACGRRQPGQSEADL